MTEKQFQSQVIAIAKQFGWAAYHTYDSRRSEPGFPDLVLVKDRVLFRELKTDTGRISEAQKLWESMLLKAGADFKIWRPKDIDAITEELSNKYWIYQECYECKRQYEISEGLDTKFIRNGIRYPLCNRCKAKDRELKNIGKPK